MLRAIAHFPCLHCLASCKSLELFGVMQLRGPIVLQEMEKKAHTGCITAVNFKIINNKKKGTYDNANKCILEFVAWWQHNNYV